MPYDYDLEEPSGSRVEPSKARRRFRRQRRRNRRIERKASRAGLTIQEYEERQAARKAAKDKLKNAGYDQVLKSLTHRAGLADQATIAAERERAASLSRAAENRSLLMQEQQRQLQARSQQQQLLGQVMDQALGKGGPSVALQQLRIGQDAAVQQAAALAASQRGSPALSARNAAMQQAQVAQATNQQAALLRAQEQLAAQGLAGQLAGQVREGDFAGRQLFGAHEMGQYGLGIQNQQQALDALQAQQNISLGFSAEGRAREAQEDEERNRKLSAGLQGAGTGLGALMTLFSDRRLKTSIKERSSRRAIDELLERATPKEFRYIDDNGGTKRLGIMAQDLEKSELGKSLVIETPRGKAVNVGQATGVALAALSHLNARIKRIERKAGH